MLPSSSSSGAIFQASSSSDARRILCASRASTMSGSGVASGSPAAAETLEISPISVVLEAAPASRAPASLHLCFRLGFLANSSFKVEPAAMPCRMMDDGLAVVGILPLIDTTRSPTLILPSRAACESGLISVTTSFGPRIRPRPSGVFNSSTE